MLLSCKNSEYSRCERNWEPHRFSYDRIQQQS